MSTFFERTARELVKKDNKLLKLEKLIEWGKLRGLVKRPRGAGGQEPYDELSMLKALVLQAWHNLSDSELEEALSTRLDFILFCGFERNGGHVPDETTFCRFRNILSAKDTFSKVLEIINEELASKGLKLKESAGALIDATVIDSVAKPNKSIEVTDGEVAVVHSADPDATYTIKRNVPRLGYKCFARCDDEGFVERTRTLPANQAEINNMEPLLEGTRKGQRVYADKGFDSNANRAILKKLNLRDAIQRKAKRNKELNKNNVIRNKIIGGKRFKIEQVFGTVKRKFGFFRASYLTTKKVQSQFTIKAVCCNLLKALNREINNSPPAFAT